MTQIRQIEKIEHIQAQEKSGKYDGDHSDEDEELSDHVVSVGRAYEQYNTCATGCHASDNAMSVGRWRRAWRVRQPIILI